MDKTKLLNRNIILFYLISLFGGVSFIYDLILVIYYKSFGISFTEISLILITVSIFSLIVEVPSGVFADLHGKKKSLIIANTGFVLSFSIIALFPSLPFFILAAALMGISQAFGSGAKQALVYDTLKTLKNEKKYLQINSRITTIFLITTIATAYFGPFLYSINKLIPIIISAVFGILTLILNCLLYERHQTKVKKLDLKEHYSQMKTSLLFTLSHHKIMWLILFSALVSLVPRILGDFISTPYLLDLGFVLMQIAIIELITNIIQAGLTYVIPRFEKKLGENKSMLSIVIGGSVLLFSTLFINNYFIGVILGCFWGLMTFKELIVDNYINHHLQKENRATVISIHSMFISLVAIIVLPLVGFFVDKTSTITVVFYTAIIYLVLGLLFMLYKIVKKI